MTVEGELLLWHIITVCKYMQCKRVRSGIEIILLLVFYRIWLLNGKTGYLTAIARQGKVLRIGC